MNIKEMVKLLEKGKKMRRVDWDKNCYIKIKKCGCCITQIDYKGEDVGDCIFSTDDINAKDWETKE